MNERKRRLKTGIFLAGGVLLVLAILFFLGGQDLFSQKITVCTYFEESVQGLSRGSAVKFKGAPVGTVSDVRINFPNYVLVEMEIDVSRFTNARRKFESEFLREVREKGLRCRLEYAGITGLKFVDFDYHPGAEQKFEPPNFIANPDAIYVPSVRSSFVDVYTTVVAAIDKINQIDIKSMSEEANEILRDLRGLLSDPALVSTLRHFKEVASHLENVSGRIENVIDEERMEKLVSSLEANLKNLESFIRRMDDAAAGADIPKSATAFRDSLGRVSESAEAVTRASASVVESRHELGNTLLKLNQTIDSLRMLIDYLEGEPGALLRGKNRPNESK